MLSEILTDDILDVKFKLDNPKRSEIHRLVKVIWVKNRNVGAQFNDRKLFETDLAYYLKKIDCYYKEMIWYFLSWIYLA